MHKEENHKFMGMWMFLLRTVSRRKSKECWFVLNGVPIRYSLREVGVSYGLYCHEYQHDYEILGSSDIFKRNFGPTKKVTLANVEEKLDSMPGGGDSLKMDVLYFLAGVIVGKKKGPQVWHPLEKNSPPKTSRRSSTGSPGVATVIKIPPGNLSLRCQ